MEKLLSCRHFGYDCDFEACGDTAEETLETAIDHARAIRGMMDLSERGLMRLRGEIHEPFCVPKGGYNPGGIGVY